jgi:ABC-type Fe3+ transport system permease subunit
MDALLLARLNIAMVAAIVAAIGAVLAWLAGREVKRARREGTKTEIAEAERQQRRAAVGALVFGLLAGLFFVLPVFGVP